MNWILTVGFVLITSLVVSPYLEAQQKPARASLASLKDLSRYVGEYPCQNGILDSPVLHAALRRTLTSEYEEYRKHLRLSGCGAIEKRGPYFLMDVSQLHVGGYSSIMLVRQSDGGLFLLWLKTMVRDESLKVYSDGPIESSAIKEFGRAMNVAWGHVACFAPEGDTLKVDTTRHANQDTGECR